MFALRLVIPGCKFNSQVRSKRNAGEKKKNFCRRRKQCNFYNEMGRSVAKRTRVGVHSRHSLEINTKPTKTHRIKYGINERDNVNG